MSGHSHSFQGFNLFSGELMCPVQEHTWHNQWGSNQWGSNQGTLDSESDALPLRHCAPLEVLNMYIKQTYYLKKTISIFCALVSNQHTGEPKISHICINRVLPLVIMQKEL